MREGGNESNGSDECNDGAEERPTVVLGRDYVPVRAMSGAEEYQP